MWTGPRKEDGIKIPLLNCHDTDGNQQFSILVFTHTFSFHTHSLGTEFPGSAQSFTHLSVSSGFSSAANAACSDGSLSA